MDPTQQYRTALRLWLTYTENQQRLSARLFRDRADDEKLQSLLDENERLREQALELTRQLLGATQAGLADSDSIGGDQA